MNRKFTVILTAVVLLLGVVGSAGAQGVTPQTLLPGALIPKFADPLPVAGDISVVFANTGPGPLTYNIHMREFRSQILPSAGIPANPKAGFLGLPAGTSSPVWGYLIDADIPAAGTIPVRKSYLGPVVVAKKGVETQPTYINALPYGTASLVQPLLPIDQTLDWANPLGTTGCVGTACGIYLGPQPAVPHIHGGEVEPAFDGGPDAWWTPGVVQKGVGFPGTTFTYPTQQQAGTIWFHDHALGVTRLNVFAGMAGLYIITDPGVEPIGMPAFPQYDIPLIIQDRSFDTQGRIFYNLASNPQPNPLVHPFWIPEFIGDAILVNGKTWPYLNVEPRQYRFRLVNGSNARFYDLTLSNAAPFLVIATDDGYLNNPVSTPNLIIAPGERYEVIVDFTNAVANTNIILRNSARTPFPGGGKVVTGTTDTVMQFRVSLPLNAAIPNTAVTAATNLRPSNAIVNIKTGAVANRPVPVAGVCPAVTASQTIVRQLTLNEVIGPGGPLELVLNNTKYNGIINGFTQRDSEQPAVGDTEIWEIINITADAHPMHTHLASFQLLNRQAFQATKWTNVYAGQLAVTFGAVPDGKGPPNPYLVRNADCAIGGNPPIGPYLQKGVRLPLLHENGWKDTVIAYPGEVTRIVVRWAPTDAPASGTLCNATTPVPPCVPFAGVNLYPFNPGALIGGVGYVWHCHIVDHEDNEMMRPYIVGATRQLIQ